MLNLKIEATSVIGHWSSNLISKESKVTGIIADNQIKYKLKALLTHIAQDT